MGAWWKRGTTAGKQPPPKMRAVAYFRHSAQDRQENSVPIQREQVQKWATDHGVEIIREFADYGKSGLSTEHRDAFNDMIENWVKKRNDFQFLLVLDVSRWGRFQDTDLSATYSAECTKHGKKVVYTTIGMPKENDPLYTIYVGFERYRAAQFSRELSDKVFKGCAKISQQGYRAGGMPPYALHRVLLNEARQPVQILKPGERKSIQNQRVTLAPGDAHAVAVVTRIFDAFVRGTVEIEIAETLRKDRIPSPGGASWDAGKVRHILQNEMYTGTLVYNKTTQRLLAKTRPNPRDQWIRTPNAFNGIVSREVFDKAQAVFQERARRATRENMLARMKVHYEEHGFIKDSLIRADPLAPPPGAYIRCFGSLDAAFLSIFADVLENIRRHVKDQLSAAGTKLEECEDFLVLNGCLTVLIQPSVPVPYGCRTYWSFRPDRRTEIDITLGVPLSNSGRFDVLGYLAFPRLMTRERCIRLSSASDSRIEMSGHNGLDFIKELAR